MGVVFAKTPKGHEEITSKAGGLTPRVRRALIFVDGKRTVDELRGMLQSDDLQHTLGMLEEEGYIAVGAVVAEPLTGRSGLGLFIVDAVADGDAARQQVAAAVTVIAVTVAGVLGASARAAADPRIRLTGHP